MAPVRRRVLHLHRGCRRARDGVPAPHRTQPVHVALKALRVAESHLAQESQEDEDTAQAEQQRRGATHGQDAMRIGRQAKGRRPTTTQTERRGGLFHGMPMSYLRSDQ